MANQDQVEFSFGKGIGKTVYEHMDQAEKSIFVLSPYVSKGYIDFLLRKQSEGISVKLVTTTQAQDGMAQFYKKVIFQNRTTDTLRLSYKQKAKKYCCCVGALLLIVSLLSVLIFKYEHHIRTFFLAIARFSALHYWLVVGFFLLMAVVIFLYRQFHRIPIYQYSYESHIPFSAIKTPYDHVGSGQPFVHAKLFIIDNKHLFVGSLNFTRAGFRQNIESVVKLTDPRLQSLPLAILTIILSMRLI